LGRLSPLGGRGPTYNILRMALELELAKQATDAQRATNKQTLDIVEGSTPSEAQGATAQEEPGMGNPGHPKS
jgi:hypothetical protein